MANKTTESNNLSESCVLGAFTGGGFKMIKLINSQSAFEDGTKFAFFLRFSVLPLIALCCFPENCSSIEYVFHTQKCLLILSSFLYFEV